MFNKELSLSKNYLLFNKELSLLIIVIAIIFIHFIYTATNTHR